MKKIVIPVAVATMCAAGFVCYKTYENRTMSAQETLIQKNIEAITRDEWDGWVKGAAMESVWRPTGAHISVGSNGGGGGVEGEWINCCRGTSEYDACNMSASNMGC